MPAVTIKAVFFGYCVMLSQAASVYAGDGAWTNKAGQVLVAAPVSINGSQVLFTNKKQSISYPLSVFMPSEQIRLKAALGIVDVPKELQASYQVGQRMLDRLRVLHDAGKISDQEYEQSCVKARKTLQSRINLSNPASAGSQ